MAKKPTQPAQPNPLEQVAQNELAMLDVHAQLEEQRQAQPKKITAETIMKASEILRKYKGAKANLEKKIVADEEFWKLRQWNTRTKKDEDFTPATSWLWSCIQSRYSDMMDSYPTCNFLARQQDDKAEAKMLSSIVPVIMEQNRYEETYSDIAWYMLKHGGCVQGVFWDKSKHNGLGDIEIRKVDFLNLFWEGGITDLQDSENVFCVELVSNRLLEQRYPELVGHLQSKKIDVAHYLYDDSVDVSDKSVVVDWYYHTEYNGKKVLQYCKFCEDVVLYATENDTEVPTTQQIDENTGIPVIMPTGQPSIAERGLYDHALYPFVVQPLYPIEGSICGYGLTDIGKDAQLQIDVLNKAVTDNTATNAFPQFFVSESCGINEEEFLDVRKPIKKIQGNITDKIMPIGSNPLSGVAVDVLNQKIEELKYVTANQDVGVGINPSGVTAGSAISALQEAQGKNARSSNKAMYRAYRDVVYQVVELIRQFYDLPRTFRIAPDATQTQEQYVSFDNSGLVPQMQAVSGMNMGLRKPEFDIEVTAEKSSPYKRMEQNELALQFYAQGFFNPQLADQALGCLQMMDFPHKEEIMMRIQQNGTIQQLLLQYQQIALQLAQQVGNPHLVEQLSQAVLQTAGQAVPDAGMPQLTGGADHPFNEKARETARESTQVE